MKHHLKNILRLWKILEPFHKYFYLQLFLILCTQGIVVWYAKLSSDILNSLITRDPRLIMSFLFIWAFVILLDKTIEFASKTNSTKNLDQKIYQHLQEFSFKKLFSLNVSQYIEEHSALKLTIIQKGENSIEQIIDKIITTVIPTLALIVISTITLAFYSPLIAGVSFVIIIIIFAWAYSFNQKQYPFIITNRDNWNLQSKFRSDSFMHLQLIKTLNRATYFLKTYLKKRLETTTYHIQTRLRSNKHTIARETFTEFATFFSLGLAVILFLRDEYTIGTIYLIWSLTSRVYWQISTLGQTTRDIPLLYVDTEKYFTIIDKEPMFTESGNKRVDLHGDIVFNNVSFTYPKHGTPIFENLNFSISQGKKTAFVGSSGSGKTTIVKLILRNYDYTSGSITINNNELKNTDAGTIREHIGYVEQHVDLLDDTVKENILIGVKEKDRKKAEEKLEEIAEYSRITEFYHRLGDTRFDTFIGERGVKLSGGERQRIGIARAIIKNPEILIFDEATASLDTENEAKVMEAINDVSKGKTTIIIAHRLSTVRDADKIIVMDKGAVVGEGTHDELMQSNTIYQNLVAHQLSS